MVAKGGVPDADAPNDPDSMRYWVTLGMEETNVESTETSVSISGQVRNQQAMEALSSKSVAAPLVTVPDPNEMVRNQLAAAAASTAPSAPTETPLRPRGSTILYVVRLKIFIAL